MSEPAKPCESCLTVPAVRRQRFCKECRKDQIMSLKASGFLAEIPRSMGSRDADQRQASDDPGPWAENATRALEGDDAS